MKRPVIVGLSLLALLVVGLAASAGPFGLFAESKPVATWRVGPQKVRLEVVTDENLSTPILFVPQSLLIDVGERKADSRSTSPVVIGLVLSAAFAGGGLWMFGKTGRRASALVLVVALTGIGVGTVWADLPRPWWDKTPRYDPRNYLANIPNLVPAPKETPPAVPSDVSLPRNISMEIVKDAPGLVLKVPAKKATVEPAKPEPVNAGPPRPIATSSKQ